jgi:hypothetical protein
MSAKRTFIFTQGCGKQRGAALMVMLVIMVIGVATILVSVLRSSSLQIERDKSTADALAKARNALIGRAVSDNTIPGSLPCPDTNDDGIAELLSGNDCPSYIGRLPWKTLGLPELRDGNGEHLWYALSPAFRDDNSAQPLNSNTKGTILVYKADGATLQTQPGYSAVAVIFAPGSPVGSQSRGSAAEQNDPANYLDSANSRNNASPIGTSNPGPFIAGAKTDTFNDQLLIITTQDLIPLIEKRVAGEVKKALTSYYTANGYYPWPDDMTASADYDSNAALNQGWLPYHTAPGSIPEWCCTAFPAWFYNNQWYTLIYYSVAEYYSPDPYDFGCSSCKLSVDGTGGVRVLFFMPGTPIGTLTRSLTYLPDYLEDSINNNHPGGNDSYITPTSKAFDRDRLYWLSSSSIWNQ